VQRGSLKTLELVKAYSVPVRDERARELVTWYLRTLQKAIDMIWDNIEWEYRFPKLVRKGRRLTVITGLKIRIPMIPKDKVFEKMLRNMLMKDNPYASHWVDAVIRTAYSIMESWRKRYLEGGRKEKKPRMRGFPHSYDPEDSMKAELWAGVTPSGRSPVIWAPIKKALRQ